MTLKELFNNTINADIYELYIWSNWFFNKKQSCIDCVNTYKVLGQVPPCHRCTPVKNLIKNLEKGNLNEKAKQ